jgi:hypothetical protein
MHRRLRPEPDFFVRRSLNFLDICLVIRPRTALMLSAGRVLGKGTGVPSLKHVSCEVTPDAKT